LAAVTVERQIVALAAFSAMLKEETVVLTIITIKVLLTMVMAETAELVCSYNRGSHYRSFSPNTHRFDIWFSV
jgi:hypothetical protein